MNAKQLWQAALERVRAQVSDASYATWFKATEGIELNAAGLVVGVANEFAREHLRQRFRDVTASAVAGVLGHPVAITYVKQLPHAPPVNEQREPATTRYRTATSVGQASGSASASQRAARPVRQQRQATVDAPHVPSSRGAVRPARPHAAQPPLLTLLSEPASHMSPASMPRTKERSSSTRVPDAPSRQANGTGHNRGAFGVDPASRYVFQTFIAGRANLLAYAAAQEVAKAPGQAYNPLFIYGGTGMGKTHLLLAIGHVARSKGFHVCYVPAEQFANDIIEAIRCHTTEEFRARYRTVDVLLVDDIQFIAGKQATEEEFFHTFNALHDNNRQIVLSSDRTPKAMHHLQDRLRSRFEWGLLADIHPPDLEHRIAILRAKASSLGLSVPEPALAAIARPECTSVRELEGALNRVLAYAEMLRLPLDDAVVTQALAPLRSTQDRVVGTEEVLAAVARHFAVTMDALRSKARDHSIAWPRQVAMYVLREETPASLSQIGQLLGGRDHTTVMHGYTHVSHEVAANERTRQDINALRAELRGGSSVDQGAGSGSR